MSHVGLTRVYTDSQLSKAIYTIGNVNKQLDKCGFPGVGVYVPSDMDRERWVHSYNTGHFIMLFGPASNRYMVLERKNML